MKHLSMIGLMRKFYAQAPLKKPESKQCPHCHAVFVQNPGAWCPICWASLSVFSANTA